MKNERIITRVILVCQVIVSAFVDLLIVVAITGYRSSEQLITLLTNTLPVGIELESSVIEDYIGCSRWEQLK